MRSILPWRVHVESKITTQSVAEYLKYNSRPNAFSFLRQQTQRNKSLKIGWISGCGKWVTMIINQRYFVQINFHNDLLVKCNVTSRIILIYSYTTQWISELHRPLAQIFHLQLSRYKCRARRADIAHRNCTGNALPILQRIDVVLNCSTVRSKLFNCFQHNLQ